MGETFSSLPLQDNSTPCLVNSFFTQNTPCTASLVLPATGLFSHYKADITITRLYTVTIPGNRIEFAQSATGISSAAVYFRINAIATGPGGTSAETTTLYRLVL
jgi:hypothetical protein